MWTQPVACHACGERADRTFRGRPVCFDCEEELRWGETHDSNVEFFFERDDDAFVQHRLYHGASPADELRAALGEPSVDFDPE